MDGDRIEWIKNKRSRIGSYLFRLFLGGDQLGFMARGELTATLLSDEDRNRTWTDGVFRFRDEPLSMIVSRLEKYYGIEIAVDDSLGSVRYNSVTILNVSPS